MVNENDTKTKDYDFDNFFDNVDDDRLYDEDDTH